MSEEKPNRFILLEPSEAGMICGIYGLTATEAIGLLQAGLFYAQEKMKQDIRMVIPKKEEQTEKGNE